MKKKIISFLFLIGLIGSMKAERDDAGQLAVALAQTAVNVYGKHDQQSRSLPSQRTMLRQLYWLDKNNPHFYKLHAYQENFDYYIAALTDHIKALESKIALGGNGLTSWSMAKGVGLSGFSALCGYATHLIWQSRNNINVTDSVNRQINMDVTVCMGLVSAAVAVVAADKFYKVLRYAERLIERLERDKRILVIFQNEKPNLCKNHIVSAALKLIEVVAEAIEKKTPVQQIEIADAAAVQQEIIAHVIEQNDVKADVQSEIIEVTVVDEDVVLG